MSTSASKTPLTVNAPTILFAGTLFQSALLLFFIQPVIAKMLLPLLGGAPAVWTTCMVFFQGALLAGYAYAHQLSRLGPKRQVLIHLSMTAASLVFLPIKITKFGVILDQWHPILAVLATLTFSIGLPFFALSANAPLLQKWFAAVQGKQAKNPYALYVASNIGSLLSLAAYPSLIESEYGLRQQSLLWSFGFGTFLCLLLICAKSFWKTHAEKIQETNVAPLPVSRTQKFHWLALAAVPSSMMLGVTTFITLDIASLPLFWIIPLGLYLFTYIIAFGFYSRGIHRVLNWVLFALVSSLLFVLYSHYPIPMRYSILLHLGTFFLVSTFCHGQLSLNRPAPQHLTEFYLWLSFGGVLGGLFNGIVAPLVFTSAAEYPSILVAVLGILLFNRSTVGKGKAKILSLLRDICLAAAVGYFTWWIFDQHPLLKMSWTWIQRIHLNPRGSFPYFFQFAGPLLIAGIAALAFRSRRTFVLAAALYTVVVHYIDERNNGLVEKKRSFFGILKVADEPGGAARTLMNGTTLHGRQSLNPEYVTMPLTYYHPNGPVGDIFRDFNERVENHQVASIGLGTGSLAAYGVPGQRWTIYEIDGDVRDLTSKHFTFINNSQAAVNIVLGDARLKLAEAPASNYDLVLVDAFSSDAIPVHLLTKEAVTLYFSKLSENGMAAIHISNRHLDLLPVIAGIAKELNLVGYYNMDQADDQMGKAASVWTLLGRTRESLGTISYHTEWRSLIANPKMPVWTDDFSSLLGVLHL